MLGGISKIDLNCYHYNLTYQMTALQELIVQYHSTTKYPSNSEEHNKLELSEAEYGPHLV